MLVWFRYEIDMAHKDLLQAAIDRGRDSIRAWMEVSNTIDSTIVYIAIAL